MSCALYQIQTQITNFESWKNLIDVVTTAFEIKQFLWNLLNHGISLRDYDLSSVCLIDSHTGFGMVLLEVYVLLHNI